MRQISELALARRADQDSRSGEKPRPLALEAAVDRFETKTLLEIDRRRKKADEQAESGLANGEGTTNQEVARQLETSEGEVTKWAKTWIERTLEPVAEILKATPWLTPSLAIRIVLLVIGIRV